MKMIMVIKWWHNEHFWLVPKWGEVLAIRKFFIKESLRAPSHYVYLLAHSSCGDHDDVFVDVVLC